VRALPTHRPHAGVGGRRRRLLFDIIHRRCRRPNISAPAVDEVKLLTQNFFSNSGRKTSSSFSSPSGVNWMRRKK
jgi:hypothetical protein